MVCTYGWRRDVEAPRSGPPWVRRLPSACYSIHDSVRMSPRRPSPGAAAGGGARGATLHRHGHGNEGNSPWTTGTCRFRSLRIRSRTRIDAWNYGLQYTRKRPGVSMHHGLSVDPDEVLFQLKMKF